MLTLLEAQCLPIMEPMEVVVAYLLPFICISSNCTFSITSHAAESPVRPIVAHLHQHASSSSTHLEITSLPSSV